MIYQKMNVNKQVALVSLVKDLADRERIRIPEVGYEK